MAKKTQRLLSGERLPPDSFSVRHIPPPVLDWQAAYGLYLIRMCREADRVGAALGRFVEMDPLSEEEYREHRKRRRVPGTV